SSDLATSCVQCGGHWVAATSTIPGLEQSDRGRKDLLDPSLQRVRWVLSLGLDSGRHGGFHSVVAVWPQESCAIDDPRLSLDDPYVLRLSSRRPLRVGRGVPETI